LVGDVLSETLRPVTVPVPSPLKVWTPWVLIVITLVKGSTTGEQPGQGKSGFGIVFSAKVVGLKPDGMTGPGVKGGRVPGPRNVVETRQTVWVVVA
jgi:hypothetical protein